MRGLVFLRSRDKAGDSSRGLPFYVGWEMAEKVEGAWGLEVCVEKPEIEASDAGQSRARLGEELADGGLTKQGKRLMTATGCREYMRKTLAKEFPGIMKGFVEAAKTGSVPHLKLVTELLRPVRKATSRAKGPTARFFEKLEKVKLERERVKAEKARSSEQ
jgi:hypothetical protein